MVGYDVILDCYTDEPSGLGVPPYLGVHQRYIAGCLSVQGITHYYLTIDDVRRAEGLLAPEKAVRHFTRNSASAGSLLEHARRILIVAGAFIEYEYVSAVPPRVDEVKRLLEPFGGEKILFFVLGGQDCNPVPLIGEGFSDVVTGLAYNYLLHGQRDSFVANYEALSPIAVRSADVLDQIPYPVIVELETGSGCRRRPGCSFCIESKRALPPTYRAPEDVQEEVGALGAHGAVFFRLGRQPSFYSYMGSNAEAVRRLLEGVRSACPDLKLLHVDNVDPSEVVTSDGRRITEAIVDLCTSGNIAPFGVESFDPAVRTQNNLNGTLPQIHAAIELLNDLGASRGASGLPRFLPGINLIHGLPGQSAETLDINLEHLDRILSKGYMVRRLFVRGLTDACGVTGQTEAMGSNEGVGHWQQTIHERFNIPMLKRVVPIGTVLREAYAEIHVPGGTLLRQMATCPVRIMVEGVDLPLDIPRDVVVDGYADWRTVRASVRD